MEDFIEESNFVVLYSKAFNYDIDSMTNYFENPLNVCNAPMKNQYFYFYSEGNESYLKTEGYIKRNNFLYSIIYQLGDLIKTPFKHYRFYKVKNWNGNEIKFDVFFVNYFYQNTCENQTVVYKIVSTNYCNDEEKKIYNDFLNSVKFVNYDEIYIKGIEYMIQDKNLMNEIRYSILLKNSKAEEVFNYIKGENLYIELFKGDNLNLKINGEIGNEGVSLNLYDKEGELNTQYVFEKENILNDEFSIIFTKDYSKNSRIFQKFYVKVYKINDNNCFLYIKKEIHNIVTYDKLNLLKYIFLAYFKKIRDKFEEKD